MKTKVVVVGLGMMGQQHIHALRQIGGVEVLAVADANESTASGVAQMLGFDSYYTDYRLLIDEIKPDVVHICTPNSLHYEICAYAMERGCGVYCEKPLAITVQQGEALVALAKQMGVANAVNFNYRNNAMVREMKERVHSGDSGKVFLLHGQYLQDWLMYDTDYSWRLDKSMNGESRAVADIGSHWFDTAQCVLGSKVHRVYAKLFTAIEERKKPSVAAQTFQTVQGSSYEPVSIDTEDMASIMVEFENGVFGSLLISQVSGGHKNDLTLNVDCASYSMVWEQENADKLWVSSRKGGKQLIYASQGTVQGAAKKYAPLPEGHAVAWKDALFNGINSFYEAIQNGTHTDGVQEYATLANGLHIMKIVEACLESNKSGQWIQIV